MYSSSERYKNIKMMYGNLNTEYRPITCIKFENLDENPYITKAAPIIESPFTVEVQYEIYKYLISHPCIRVLSAFYSEHQQKYCMAAEYLLKLRKGEKSCFVRVMESSYEECLAGCVNGLLEYFSDKDKAEIRRLL